MLEVFLAELQSWKGTPFAHGQGCKGVGVDCWQLIREGLCVAGIPTPSGSYGRSAQKERLLDALYQIGLEVGDARRGDLLYLEAPLLPYHLAACTTEGWMIHALPGGVVETPLIPPWDKRIRKIFRPSFY